MKTKYTHIGIVSRWSYGSKMATFNVKIRETPKMWIDDRGLRYSKSSGWAGDSQLDLETITRQEGTE